MCDRPECRECHCAYLAGLWVRIVREEHRREQAYREKFAREHGGPVPVYPLKSVPVPKENDHGDEPTPAPAG